MSTFRIPTCRASILAAVVISLGACQAGEDAMPQDAAPASVDLLDALSTRTEVVEQKLVDLAQATPESDYDWRPGEGVRSIAEVYIHVAADNYLIPMMMGVEPPASTGITSDFATVAAYQDRDIPKAQIIEELTASFRFLDQALAETRGDLGATKDFFGQTQQVGEIWTLTVTHLHEHLGQSIAYARSVGVTPPWSM